jgi:hypothetical protein
MQKWLRLRGWYRDRGNQNYWSYMTIQGSNLDSERLKKAVCGCVATCRIKGPKVPRVICQFADVLQRLVEWIGKDVAEALRELDDIPVEATSKDVPDPVTVFTMCRALQCAVCNEFGTSSFCFAQIHTQKTKGWSLNGQLQY